MEQSESQKGGGRYLVHRGMGKARLMTGHTHPRHDASVRRLLRRIVLGVRLRPYVIKITGLIGPTIAIRSMDYLGRPPDLRDGK